MKLNLIVKIKGYAGKWRVLEKEQIKDKNNKVKDVFALESTTLGESATVFAWDNDGKIEIIEGPTDFDDVKLVMESVTW